MDTLAIHILNPTLLQTNGNIYLYCFIILIKYLIYYFVGELENSGLINIRKQINKLSKDLNMTRKGLDVFSGERKTIPPSKTELTFSNEFKKKIKESKVNIL